MRSVQHRDCLLLSRNLAGIHTGYGNSKSPVYEVFHCPHQIYLAEERQCLRQGTISPGCHDHINNLKVRSLKTGNIKKIKGAIPPSSLIFLCVASRKTESDWSRLAETNPCEKR